MRTIEEKLRSIIEKVLIQSNITLEDIILFGSRARGDYHEKSDFDIFILINDEINITQKRELWENVYHTLHKEFPTIPFDIIIKTKKGFEEEKDVVNTISNEVFIEGIRI